MFESERLIIRRGNELDVDDVCEFRNTEFVLKYNAMEIADKASILKEIVYSYVLYEKNLKKVIGVLSSEEDTLRYGVKSQCISYYLNEKYSHKGYMSEALQVFIQHLFDEGCEIVSARVFVGNDASVRLLKKLGFKHEGTLRYAVKGYRGVIHDDQLFSLMKK